MAAGGHYLSDVIWSALLAFGVCHLLYHCVLRVSGARTSATFAWAARLAHPRLHRLTAVGAALGGVCVLIALFATPHGTEVNAAVPLSSLPQPPRVIEVQAQQANIEIVLVDPPASQVSIQGELHGFGLPTSQLRAHVDFVPEPAPTLRYRIEQKGWFTDLDGVATVLIPAGELERVVVRLAHGNIRVRDETHDAVVRRGIVQLDLVTAAGHVQLPDRSHAAGSTEAASCDCEAR
jgi:hypothetical protein